MKLISFLSFILCLLASAGVRAQTSTLDAIDTAAEHLRIKTQQAAHEAQYSQAMQACYERFLVFDCQHDAKRVRRVALDELRRQELVLNDLERQANAVSTLQRINQKMSPERQAEQALAREQALQDDLERRKRADEKKATASKTATVSVPSANASEPGSSASERLVREQRFADKIKEAEQHKLEKAKIRAEKGSGSAKPLPVPAGF